QYRNVKADYVKHLWNVVNWDEVSKRFADARAGKNGLLLP
ncbi:Fe-Mn family superoxide dismutase, partial [Saccharopolyspora sp. NPDC003752]